MPLSLIAQSSASSLNVISSYPHQWKHFTEPPAPAQVMETDVIALTDDGPIDSYQDVVPKFDLRRSCELNSTTGKKSNQQILVKFSYDEAVPLGDFKSGLSNDNREC